MNPVAVTASRISYFDGVSNPDEHFRLTKPFLDKYKDAKPNFGFNGLGEIVFYRTYSRLKKDGVKETFAEVVQRVVEGCYEIQRRHCRKLHIPWNYEKAQRSAEEMFTRIWQFKFLPPGRGLWMMGTDFMWTRGSAALNNCSFVSTKDLASEPAEPFCFMMDMSMLGVGVGFDTRGAGTLLIKSPGEGETPFVVSDSREGWVESLRVLIESYTLIPRLGQVKFDYSEVRPAGSIIQGFGGKAAGAGILAELHSMVRKLLDARIGQHLSSVDIVDLMNYIGKCVVAGNVRRSSEISLGEIDDADYLSMKDYTRFPNEVVSHRWASNNSVIARVGSDYTQISQQLAVNGEPGILWLDNVRDYGRMIDGRQPGIDGRASGTNPCSEISLESCEMCNLCETFPVNHEDADDYLRTLKFAYLYSKTVTLLPTHNARTNSVMLRNRRIGLSQSGIVQAFAKFGRRNVLTNFCDAGYHEVRRWDEVYSDWLCIPRSIKVTSVKPSGSVSLVAGVTPGIHYPEATIYWRRMRINKDSSLTKALKAAGYEVEPAITDPENTAVVKFAVIDETVKPVSEVSIWQQAADVVAYNSYWSDNQVSVTIKFKPEEAKDIKPLLEAYEDMLKSISFLPFSDHGYAQAPYEPCTKEEAEAYLATLRPVDLFPYIYEEAAGSIFCDGEKCEIIS